MSDKKEWVTVGDDTDHGGKVLTGSSQHKIKGRPIARLGDQLSCPLLYPDGRPHGINRIATASGPKMGGIPSALSGDKGECGCSLIGSASARFGR
ncbi:PAAR domain-containing protein [Cupriavidus sp. PET2-C1]